MRPLILFAMILLSGCKPTIEPANIGSRTDIGFIGDVYTVQHDGHEFVVVRGTECVGILHHPGCRCLKQPEKVEE